MGVRVGESLVARNSTDQLLVQGRRKIERQNWNFEGLALLSCIRKEGPRNKLLEDGPQVQGT